MRTSAAGVLAAGDGTGVEGSLVAIDEGRLAGLGAALDLGAISRSAAEAEAAPIRRRLSRNAGRSSAPWPHMHRVGPGIYELADTGDRGLPLRGGHAASARRRDRCHRRS